MKHLGLVATVFVAVVGPALAQGSTLSEADTSYLVQDRRGASYELESAKLAVNRAAREDVKSYAQKLVHDHEAYNAALEKLGVQEGVTLPTEPDAADKAHMADLEKLNGKAFETLYIQEALRINAEDKSAAEKEKATTDNPAIKAFIAKFADVDAEHERLAKNLDASSG